MFRKNDDKICPFLKKACIKHDCNLYIHLLGKNPQTESMVDEWGCAIAWGPILSIENTQAVNQAGSSFESFRNIILRLASGEKPADILRSDEMKLLQRNMNANPL